MPTDCAPIYPHRFWCRPEKEKENTEGTKADDAGSDFPYANRRHFDGPMNAATGVWDEPECVPPPELDPRVITSAFEDPNPPEVWESSDLA